MTCSIRSLAGMLAGVLLAVTTGASADSSVGGEIMAAAAAANRFLGTLDQAQARMAVLPAASPLTPSEHAAIVKKGRQTSGG